MVSYDEDFDSDYNDEQRLKAEPLMQHFPFAYRGVEEHFYELAKGLVLHKDPGLERTEALKKLIECQDWYGRA